jgi:hypothetical protein
MAIPCYFKFSTKPTTPKKPISASKKNRLFQKIWLLEQDATLLEAELHDFGTHRRKLSRKQQPSPTPASWQVCIQQLQHQLIMETNITNVAELFALMQQVAVHFQIQHIPPIPRHSNQVDLPVTLKVTPFEKALRDLFTTLATSSDSTITTATITNTTPIATPPLTPPSSTTSSQTSTLYFLAEFEDQQEALATIKQQLIDIYFTCQHLHNPLLIQSYYHGYMHQHLDDMISWATVAFTTYSPCIHVSDLFAQQTYWTRQQVGERCQLEAKRLFDEAIFGDDDSSVSLIFTAYLLTHCACFTLHNRQAHVYADVAWQMSVQLKQTHVPHLTSPTHDSMAWIYAEVWRRLYTVTRFMVISFNLVNDHRLDISALAAHAMGIGFPHLAPCEQDDPALADAVHAYHDLAKLHHVAFLSNISSLSMRLYSGKLATVGSNDLRAMEARFVGFWYALPPSHRLGSAPLAPLPMADIHQCPSFRSLRVNAAYYLMLMSTLLRLMPTVGTDHALEVVSLCCDAIIKIYKVMHARAPCTIELHWLIIVLDTVLLLLDAKDPEVRRRAKQGAKDAKELFMRHGSSQDYCSPSPIYSHTLYHAVLAQRMHAHLATKDTAF